ncbi:MAG: hypothetical protein K8I27_00170 [Planctomycetes bacterium]|nr:hypothetical protein [Planctomycetota bacterium]
MEVSAEQAYLFRHAVVRDAAYHLQPPSERAVLHALALDVIVALPGLNEGAYGLELAQHARWAQAHDRRFEAQERRYLKLGGDFARFNYDYANALDAYRRLHELLVNQPAERALAADSLADLLERLGRWQEALVCFEEVRAHAADPEYRGRALVHLAWIGMETGGDVEDYLREARDLGEQVNSDRLRIAVLMCEAKRHATGGRHDRALETMREVIDFAHRTSDWAQEMAAHSNAADYAIQAGDLVVAQAHNDRAETFARDPRARHFLVGVLLNRTNLAIRRREFEAALTCADESVRIAVETRSRGLAGAALNARAIALTGQGQYVEAWQSFEEVRPIIAETGDATLGARWLTARSELLRLWNKPEHAIDDLEAGVHELAGRVPDRTVSGVRVELALCHAALGMQEDALSVISSLDDARPDSLVPVYRGGLLHSQGEDEEAVNELTGWLKNEPAPGVYAEPLDFLARAWLALALEQIGRDAGPAARDALRVAEHRKLSRHPSPPLGQLIRRCVELANESPDFVDEG